MLHSANDTSGVCEILGAPAETFEYGMHTVDGGRYQNPEQQARVINRVLGTKTEATHGAIIQSFNNFDNWAKTNLSKKIMSAGKLGGNNALFDTNFNAQNLASRRIERSLFIKLKNNEDQLTNFYKHRYNSKSNVRLDPNGL